MTKEQFQAVVQSLGLERESQVMIWKVGCRHSSYAVITRMAKDGSWFNADVQTRINASAVAWTNGKRIDAEAVYNIAKVS